MGEVKSIDGGPLEPDEFLGEYIMVYFDEDGNITPIWTEGLTEQQLCYGTQKLVAEVNLFCFTETEEYDYEP